MAPDLAASVRARLLQIAKAEKTDFNAVLFHLWYAMPHRPTRDVDLLGFGASDLGAIAQAFRDIVTVAAEDGMVFDAASVVVDDIRKNAGYAGARVLVSAELARARCMIQVDIGFGDAVTRMELLSYHGLQETDRASIVFLLDRMQYLPITRAIEDATITFRQKNKGKLPDAIIAATAAHHQLELDAAR